MDPILIYISLWIDCLFEIHKIAACFLVFFVVITGSLMRLFSRNFEVWPLYFLTNVFIALKGTQFCIFIIINVMEKHCMCILIQKKSKSLWYTMSRCWYMCSRECSQISVSCWQISQFMTNQTELIIFRSPGISDAGIQRLGAYADGQRMRYVLLSHTNGPCSLCCSNTPYDNGNVAFLTLSTLHVEFCCILE